MNAGNLNSGSSAFSKYRLYFWNFLVHILLKPSLKNFEHYLPNMQKDHNCTAVWTFFGIALLWNWNEKWPFPVLLPLLSFQIWWHIEFSTLTASSFKVLNSSTKIPAPLLALFIVMFPKLLLTSNLYSVGKRMGNNLNIWLAWKWGGILVGLSPQSVGENALSG